MTAIYEDEGPSPQVWVHGHGNLVAGGDLNLNRPLPPPSDHPLAVHCPQCRHITWRGTQLCVHCDYDIGGWLAQVAAALHRERTIHLLRARALRLAMCAGVGALVGWAGLFTGFEQFAVWGITGVFSLGAFAALDGSTKL